MSGNLLNDQDVSINLTINTDKREILDGETVDGVVYKPTMSKDTISKLDFQSMKPDNPVEAKDTFFLYRSAFIGDLLAFSAGTTFSWTSPVIPKLQGPQSPLNQAIEASHISLIAAILCIGAAIGPFLFGSMADRIGRKRTLVAISFPMVVGFGLLSFTNQVNLYYVGRLLCGMGSGGVFTVLTMYTGEIAADHNRGKFSCILGIFVALGVFYPLFVGSFLSVQIFTLSCLVPLQMFLIFFPLYAPESPSFLVRIGHAHRAEKALTRLRGLTEEHARKVVGELQKLEEQQVKGGVAELFRSKGTRKAFVISAGLLVLQQFSGINVVTGFMENIFRAAGGDTSPQSLHRSTSLIGAIQIVTVIITSSLVERLGRKFLLFASTVGSAASIILLGLYFILQRYQFSALAHFWWLPVACLLLYIVSFNLGLGPVPWTILSEVFPDNVKSTASALASGTCFGMSFLVTLAFPIVSQTLGMAESFWVFGGCCVVGAIFIQCVVVETKGKNVTEIQEILNK